METTTLGRPTDVPAMNKVRPQCQSVQKPIRAQFLHVSGASSAHHVTCTDLSRAAEVGMLRATPFRPLLKYGMASLAYAAMMATLSEGVTKNLDPRIMLRSASPSHAAPNCGISATRRANCGA